MTYLPLFPGIERIVEEYQHHRNREIYGNRPFPSSSDVTACIPDKNEDPEIAINTVLEAANVNRYSFNNFEIGGREGLIQKVILSDQSEKKIAEENLGLLNEKYEKLKKSYSFRPDLLPEIGYLGIDDELAKELYNFSSNHQVLKPILRAMDNHDKKIYGKGFNMFLSAILNDEPEGSLVYLDSDYKDRSSRQVMALALPFKMGYDAVTATFTRYHLAPDGVIERGGRVNASTGAVFDMLSSKNLMEIMGYPLSGDQGSRIGALKDLHWAYKFGVETAWRVQYFSHLNGFENRPILKGKHVQPEIMVSDDAPIGFGKSYEEILKGVKSMSRQIPESALTSMGIDNVKRFWPTAEEFINDFESHQNNRMLAWREASLKDHGDKNNGLPLRITGAVTDSTLRDISLGAVREIVEEFYSNEDYRNVLGEQFFPSINKIRSEIKEKDYSDLRNILSKKYQRL